MTIYEHVLNVTGDDYDTLLRRLDNLDTPEAHAAAADVHRIVEALDQPVDADRWVRPNWVALEDALTRARDLLAETTTAIAEAQRAAEARLRR